MLGAVQGLACMPIWIGKLTAMVDEVAELDLVAVGVNCAPGPTGAIEILRTMLTTISRPRSETSENAPRLLRLNIDPEKIGLVSGPGGKTIRAIQESTGEETKCYHLELVRREEMLEYV